MCACTVIMCIACVHVCVRERETEREREREREKETARNSHDTLSKLKPAVPMPSIINCRIFLYSLGSSHDCEMEERC